jgi:WD40 repeat protein
MVLRWPQACLRTSTLDAQCPRKAAALYFGLSFQATHSVPGSEGLFSPRWSPSGRYIAALSADSDKLMLCDLQTGNWRQLAQGALGNPEWSHDSAYLCAQNIQGAATVRIRISTGAIEPVANLSGERIALVGLGAWYALTPDDSVVTIRDLSRQEIYALELRNP